MACQNDRSDDAQEEKSRRTGFVPPEDATAVQVAEHLQRFAQRAWRREVKQEDLTVYLNAYQSERDAGESLLDAYRVALQGVLTSRHFIYLVEGEPQIREHLTDSDLKTTVAVCSPWEGFSD